MHLDNKKNISLLKLFAETGLMIDEGEDVFSGLSSMLEKIGWSVYAQNQSAFIETVITELSSLYKADVGLFIKNSDSGDLRRINESELFPTVLPEVELARYSQIDVWSIGKRVITEVHRIARKNNFTAVASIPIGRSTKGILILALPERNFEPQEIAALTEIQRWISFFERFDNKLSELTARNSQLSESENLYNIITDNCSDLILFIDSTSKIVGANRRFVEEIGFTMYELLGRPFANFIKIEDMAMGKSLLSTINSGACQLINREGNTISVGLKILTSKIRMVGRY